MFHRPPCLSWLLFGLALLLISSAAAKPIDPRAQFGIAQLRAALSDPASYHLVLEATTDDPAARPESYTLRVDGKEARIVGADPAGVLYGCLDLARRARENGGQLSDHLAAREHPALSLRGTCILLMKLGNYEYPITPQEFPFFYDKQMWIKYLDFLAENRFNFIAFWNGHPFDYFVKLDKYPEAQSGMAPGTLEQNHDLLMWLGKEAEKRNIWLMFMFYNIHASVYMTEAHHLTPHGNREPTPLLREYTSYCIEKFVSEFPSIGLYICPGERLRVRYMEDWFNNVVFPAVKRTGKNPPIVFRDWFIDHAVLKNIVGNYSPLYTERKYNVEMLVSDHIDPANQGVSKITGRHVVNVHLLGNLEPFRWSPPSYIQRCMQSSIAEGGATGLHLYDRKPWRWPYGCDLVAAPEPQWERDWMWYESWARYAWNPNLDPKTEKAYWTARLAERFGNRQAGEALLAAQEEGADVLPALQRLTWLSDSASLCVVSGMQLQQLLRMRGVKFYPPAEPWIPIPDYIAGLASGEAPAGQSPIDFLAGKVAAAERAERAAKLAAEKATSNQEEASRWATDAAAITLVARHYHHKLAAAVAFGLWQMGKDETANLAKAQKDLAASVEDYRQLTALTTKTYESISDCPALNPFVLEKCPYHWSDLLPRWEEELATFSHNAKVLAEHPELAGQKPVPLRAVEVKSLSPDQPVVRVATGTRIYTDRDYVFGRELPQEFAGLSTLQFSNDAAKRGAAVGFETTQPARVFVAFLGDNPEWATPTAEWKHYLSGYDVINADAQVYWKQFPAGQSELKFPRGTYVLLGFAAADQPLPKMRVGDLKKEFLRRRIQ